MEKIEVKVLHESHECPAGMMMFLARLTQRGHQIKCMDDLLKLYNDSIGAHKTAAEVSRLPHGEIKRFTPITVAIVGASRRFLAQARTNKVGVNYVSASMQYSNFTNDYDFVVPYEVTQKDFEINKQLEEYAALGNCDTEEYIRSPYRKLYLNSCAASMTAYEELAEMVGHDAAGYAAPMGLRNVLIMQMNHESWSNFIRLRACRRNTTETRYVTTKIWQELLTTEDGEDLFYYAGPDCVNGSCREGKMSCGSNILTSNVRVYACLNKCSLPEAIISTEWPLLKGETNG